MSLTESKPVQKQSLKIIGTAHVSQESIEEVQASILEIKPDVVAVELDINRFNNLLKDKSGDKQNENKEINIKEIIKGDQFTLFLVSGFLSYMQKKIGEDVGVKPGSEMMAAVEAAQEIGARVALIDRDIQITLRRALNQMSFWEKMKFVYGILASFISSDEAVEDIESIKEGDTLAEVMEYFQEMSPQAFDVLVRERDAYMARMLLDITEEKVVAVVGAGHQKGIKGYMNHPDKIPPLSELLRIKKSKYSLSKIILFSLPIIFILIFLLALLNGININSSLLEYVLLTGGLAFLGSILTGSKIYSAITAFIAAPITVIHPLLAAGWFAGIVEAKLRKVSMDDLANLPKCESLRELFGNSLFRVLMVVLGANIGASIGAFLSIPNVLFPLAKSILGI